MLALLFSYNTLAQDRCGTVLYQQLLQQQNPASESTEDFESWMRDLRSTELFDFINEDTVYRIPVVVHIIHNGEPIGTGLNLAEEQIISQIEVLNEDFRRMNADPVNTQSEFVPFASKLNIEFVLARQDELGQPTTGIVRVQGEKTAYNPLSISDRELLSSYSQWDPEIYLNIFLVIQTNI